MSQSCSQSLSGAGQVSDYHRVYFGVILLAEKENFSQSHNMALKPTTEFLPGGFTQYDFVIRICLYGQMQRVD